MKAFLDTNVLLDILMESRENNVDSATILNVAEHGYICAVVSTQSILDSYYVFTRAEKQPLESFKTSLKDILSVVSVASIDENNLKAAISSSNEDFEDASQIDCALAAGCDCIISSDRKMKRDSTLIVYTPKEFCDKVFTPWH